jgi:hypothetical protein
MPDPAVVLDRERARRFLAEIARREPTLFAHWRLGAWP